MLTEPIGTILLVEMSLSFVAGCVNLFVAKHLVGPLRWLFLAIAVLALSQAGGYGWLFLFEDSPEVVSAYESIATLVGLVVVWTLPAIAVLHHQYTVARSSETVARRIETGEVLKNRV